MVYLNNQPLKKRSAVYYDTATESLGSQPEADASSALVTGEPRGEQGRNTLQDELEMMGASNQFTEENESSQLEHPRKVSYHAHIPDLIHSRNEYPSYPVPMP